MSGAMSLDERARTRLFVANVSFATAVETLRAAFEQYGPVTELNVPTDRATGKSRGFAFVTMGTKEAARAAVDGMDRALLDGRILRVREAADRPIPRGKPR
jgi:RNA recognition motif-containing protein